MQRKNLKPLLGIVVLITITGIAMAYANRVQSLRPGSTAPGPEIVSTRTGVVTIAGQLIQNKVLQGSEGLVDLTLTLAADDVGESTPEEARNVDMLIVLDRSGSMQGPKLEKARAALLNLLSTLSPRDRLGLIAYSNSVRQLSDLLPLTAAHRERLASRVAGIQAGGGTNLGAGLQAGIDMLLAASPNGNARKVILISDGLANQGITDSRALANMAAVAVVKEFSVSTVGVGADFNEDLMASIADRGAGNYYYLANPAAFAEVFQNEFYYAQAAVATGLSIRIPLPSGIALVRASGYPLEREDNQAVFFPGDLRSGQTRKIFLTLRVPTHQTQEFEIGRINVRYLHKGQPHEAALPDAFTIACVANPQEVFTSIDKAAWTEKVIKEDFNRLKQEVAADIKAGKKDQALHRIEKYYGEQEKLNDAVGSAGVTENLNKDLGELRTRVNATFQGAPAAVEHKQKSTAKALQYEGYRGRRLN
ncbi:MAG: VWA domain-containing protein [Desulfobacterales bacterium]|nr:MAG: VWA domain-containing protein [Desulfobacterales bacterium]